MLQRRHMPAYLVLVWTAFDVVLWVAGALVFGRHYSTELVLLTLVWGQFLAYTGWIALGSRGRAISLYAVGIWAASLAVADVRESSLPAISVAIATAMMLCAFYGWAFTIPLFLLRLNGFQWDYVADRHEGASPSYQVSLRWMMTLMLLVGIVASAWSAALASPDRPERSPMSAYFVMLVVPFLLPWSIWACFCWMRPLHSSLVATLVVGLWGALLVWLIGKSYEALSFAMVPSGVLIIHLTMLQVAGYRLLRS